MIKKRAAIIKTDGFTLLELLIAMTLSMLVLIVIGGAMKLGFGSVRSGQKESASGERLRAVCEILDSQVQGMVVLAAGNGVSYAFKGDSSSMQFASIHSIWGDRRGCVWVKYTVSTNDGGKQTLKAEEKAIGTGVQKETVLLPEADKVSFEYFVMQLKGEHGEWSDRLDDSRLGGEVLKVRINFTNGTKSAHMVIPVNVRDSLSNLAGGNT